MQILSPTYIQIKKLKEMILKLLPEYKYVSFEGHGLIFLSKSFWHDIFRIKRKCIHITELCTVYLPEKLERLDSRTNVENGKALPYQRIYNKYSHIVLDLLHHRANTVIDYLYDEYTDIKYGIHRNYYTANNILPEKSYTLSEILSNPIKKDGIVLSHLSNAYIKQALRRWKNASFVLNHPKLKSKYLDLWFNKEVKEQIRQIYNINIAFA